MAVAYRNKTLRQMSPVTRKVARLTGEALSVGRRFKNLVPEIQRLETDSRALASAKQQDRFGFTPEEWQDIRIAVDIVLRTESVAGHPLHLDLSPYLYMRLKQLLDKLR